MGRRHQPTLQEIAASSTSVSIRQRRNCPKPKRLSRPTNRKDLAGFPSSAAQPVFLSNLSGLEPHFRSRSTDSETMEAAAAIGTENGIIKSGVQQNPMDFEYFEKLVRSEDETTHQVIFF